MTVIEQEVQGSPFPVFVSVPLTQPGKPVKVFPTESNAIDVAVTSSNRIVVATSKELLLLDSEGECINSFQPFLCDKCMGVAVDNITDHVYAVICQWASIFSKAAKAIVGITRQKESQNTKQYCVLELNSNLSSILRRCEFQDIEGWWFSGIAVVGDEVMVCCHETNTINVFSIFEKD